MITGEWDILPPSPMRPRTYVMGGSYGHFVVVWGARGSSSSDEIPGAVFNTITNTWSPIPVGPIAHYLSNSSASVVGGKLIVTGGTSNLAASYDFELGVWSLLPSPPIKSDNFPLHSEVDGKFVLLSSFERGKIAAYDPVVNSWTQSSGYGPFSCHSATTGVKQKLFVWGGKNCSSSARFDDGWLFDLKFGRKLELPNFPVSGRTGIRAATVGNRVYLWGGLDESHHSGQGFIYDADAETWYQ